MVVWWLCSANLLNSSPILWRELLRVVSCQGSSNQGSDHLTNVPRASLCQRQFLLRKFVPSAWAKKAGFIAFAPTDRVKKTSHPLQYFVLRGIQAKDNDITFFSDCYPALGERLCGKSSLFPKHKRSLLVGKGPTFRLYAGALIERCFNAVLATHKGLTNNAC